MRLRLHRRTFLKLSAALGVAAHSFGFALRSSPAGQDKLWLAGAPIIASTLPLPFLHHYFPNAEALLTQLTQRLTAFDLLLIPAYAAAELVRRGVLRTFAGPGRSPGRAHDPDGAFTIPYTLTVSGLVYRGAPPHSLEDLWSRDALWPDSARLVMGAALLRRGYPLNDTHPGHLAQVEEDLIRLRPRLVPDPVAGLRSGAAALALAPISDYLAERKEGVFFPPEGAALIEYDWVIPLGAANPQAALAFIAHTPIHHLPAQPATLKSPLIPLTPLPAAALTQRADIWTHIKRSARVS